LKSPRDLADQQTQTVEKEIAPEVSVRLREIAERQRIAATRLQLFNSELTAKEKEVNQLQTILSFKPGPLCLSAVFSLSFRPRQTLAEVLDLKQFNRRNKAVCTELTGTILDCHKATLDTELADIAVVNGLKEAVLAIEQELTVAKRERYKIVNHGKVLSEKTEKLKEEVRKAQEKVEMEQQNQLISVQEQDGLMRRRTELTIEIRKKQQELEEKQNRNEEAAAKFVELNQLKESLQLDLEDMSQREKLAVQTLVQNVGNYDDRADESRQKLMAAEMELENKRKIRSELKNSKQMTQLKELMVEKMKIERRLEKWNGMLRNSRENAQNILGFSTLNAGRRQSLVKTLEKTQRIKIEREDELQELESYAALLNELLREQNEHWR
jgi:hypothetical protein